ncbi:MAG: hypothetical protein LBV60_21310 [Streptomyces sp.]|jgi:hypothetical protein|nr:hypothetical protein [Streptomyces sp.]
MQHDPTPARDSEEFDLVLVDQQAHRLYGPREQEWTEQQWSGYFTALETVHADYPQNHAPKAAA